MACQLCVARLRVKLRRVEFANLGFAASFMPNSIFAILRMILTFFYENCVWHISQSDPKFENPDIDALKNLRGSAAFVSKTITKTVTKNKLDGF